MKRFACGDVVPGCDATFVADTDSEILTAVAQHAAADHAMATVPDSVVEEVRRHIRAV